MSGADVMLWLCIVVVGLVVLAGLVVLTFFVAWTFTADDEKDRRRF